jgi:hypothetical protein
MNTFKGRSMPGGTDGSENRVKWSEKGIGKPKYGKKPWSFAPDNS